MIPTQIWEDFKHFLLGTAISLNFAIDQFSLLDFGLSEEDIIEALEQDSIELCPECGWWVESYELVDEYDNLCSCENCRL